MLFMYHVKKEGTPFKVLKVGAGLGISNHRAKEAMVVGEDKTNKLLGNGINAGKIFTHVI